MEFHGIPWNSMESHGKFHGIQLKKKLNGIFHGIPWENIMEKIRQMFIKKSMEFHGEFNGIPWISMEFFMKISMN
jgi:hypothetical protein